jgi:hypothetical protein
VDVPVVFHHLEQETRQVGTANGFATRGDVPGPVVATGVGFRQSRRTNHGPVETASRSRFDVVLGDLESLPGWIQTVAQFTPITYGVDAARSIILDRDVMTVVEVTQFDGLMNTLVPAVLVLAVLDLVLGSIAAYMLTRATPASAK